MLMTQFHLVDENKKTLLLNLKIRNLSGGAVSDYGVSGWLEDELLAEEVKLLDYPGWSEPVSFLVARAMLVLFPNGCELVDQSRVISIDCRTALIGLLRTPKTLQSWHWSDGRLHSWDNMHEESQGLIPMAPSNTLLERCCRVAAWGHCDQMEKPEPSSYSSCRTSLVAHWIDDFT